VVTVSGSSPSVVALPVEVMRAVESIAESRRERGEKVLVEREKKT